MCQKAFGSFYGPLVTAYDVSWTRGQRSLFSSSNRVKRGFCLECGTPLSYEAGGDIEIAIGTLDNPELAPPALQVNPDKKLSYTDGLAALDTRKDPPNSVVAQFMAGITSNQHPDYDGGEAE